MDVGDDCRGPAGIVRLLVWLEAHDSEHDGTVDGLTLGAYLDDVDRSARARCAARAANYSAAESDGPRGKPQTGKYAAEGQWKHLLRGLP